jgi:hypothetical protein
MCGNCFGIKYSTVSLPFLGNTLQSKFFPFIFTINYFMTNSKPERIEDGMIYPSDSRYAIAERAFRRGYHHGVVEFAVHAKNLPASFRTYTEIYEGQIRDWRWSFNPKDKPVCPPQM